MEDLTKEELYFLFFLLKNWKSTYIDALNSVGLGSWEVEYILMERESLVEDLLDKVQKGIEEDEDEDKKC